MTRKYITIGMISSILNLFSCSVQTNENVDGLSKEMEDQLVKSSEEFENRPIYKILTKQILDTTSDEHLLQVVFDNLSEKLPADYEKEYEIVRSWNKSQQAIYLIWILETEVNNGGYNQYYFNSSGQFYKHLPEALRLVGANKFADLTRKANETFEKENPKITQHQDGTLEGFSESYEDNPLNKFDDEFYDLYEKENLQQIQIDFIRKNKTEFINK